MRERHVRGSGDASVGDARQARPALGHDAPSGVRQAGIDSEYGAFDGRGKPPCPLPCPPTSCARRLCYKRLFVIILSHRFEERIEEAAFFHFFTALMEDPARRRTSRPMPRETPDPARIAPLRVSGDARRPTRRPTGAKKCCRWTSRLRGKAHPPPHGDREGGALLVCACGVQAEGGANGFRRGTRPSGASTRARRMRARPPRPRG